MIVPGRPLLFVAALLGIFLLGVVVLPEVLYVALAADVLLVLACLVEGRQLAAVPIRVQRKQGKKFQIERDAEFVYRLENRGEREVIVALRQLWPPTFSAEEKWTEVAVAAGEIVQVALVATPHKRGQIELPPTEVDIRFPLGVAKRRWNLEGQEKVSVYPDLQSLYAYETLRRSHALTQFGIHRRRMVGAGREFAQLREYVSDDDFRDINWNATARHRKPITNVYQAERSQDVLLCLDCGRMMGTPVENGTALDCAIDAAIMLAHAANDQGDRVGLALFKDTVELFMKPKAGRRAVNAIIEELVESEPEGVFPSYSSLVECLRVRHKRRSMVFIFTDLNDVQLTKDLAQVLPLISRRHVIVVISLRDLLLDNIANGGAVERGHVYQVLAARALVTERDARSRELSKHGIQVLEADAQELTMSVINRYLTVKMRQMV